MIPPNDNCKIETAMPDSFEDVVSRIRSDEDYLIDTRQPLELGVMAEPPLLRLSMAHRFAAEAESN